MLLTNRITHAMDSIMGLTDLTCREPLNVEIRPMIRQDVDSILRIEEDSFDNPWDSRDLKLTLQNRSSAAIVGEAIGSVLGFAVFQLGDTLEIIEMAVDAEFRRCRIGSQIVSALKGRAERKLGRKLTVHVDERNLPAQLFFKSEGFVAKAIVRESPFSTVDTVYRMEYDGTRDT